jgi:hypothetical protein
MFEGPETLPTRPLDSMEMRAPKRRCQRVPVRRRSAWDLVLAGRAVGGHEQLAVGGLQLVHREPVVPIAAQCDVFEHRQVNRR